MTIPFVTENAATGGHRGIAVVKERSREGAREGRTSERRRARKYDAVVKGLVEGREPGLGRAPLPGVLQKEGHGVA